MTKGEREASLIQAIGVASNAAVLTQVRSADLLHAFVLEHISACHQPRSDS